MTTASANRVGLERDRDRRAAVIDHLPFDYRIHLAMPCNQRCIMCVPDFNHSQATLSLPAFTELFEQVREHAAHMTLIGGETFMYPHIVEVLELLGRHPIEVTINTNAFMLNERVVPGLLALHELNLKCSIDASTRETYHRIRGRDHFERARENIERFADLARERPNIRVITVYVVMRENLGEVLPFIDWARTLSPHRIEFHPVRHVEDWRVENGTGWGFDGRQQSCRFFADEYNETMSRAAERCRAEGLEHEVILL